jgi:hypothetical protein
MIFKQTRTFCFWEFEVDLARKPLQKCSTVKGFQSRSGWRGRWENTFGRRHGGGEGKGEKEKARSQVLGQKVSFRLWDVKTFSTYFSEFEFTLRGHGDLNRTRDHLCICTAGFMENVTPDSSRCHPLSIQPGLESSPPAGSVLGSKAWSLPVFHSSPAFPIFL